MRKEKRPRIKNNKRMMAWSNGVRVNIIPSVFHQVDDFGGSVINLLNSYREGDEYYYGTCAIIREKCRCYEYEADRAWEQERHLEALNLMIYAATMVLPDESEVLEFEDAQWLNPDETLFWHENVQEFLRYNRRCKDYCLRDSRLWPIYNGSSICREYNKYLKSLHSWLHNV